MEDSVYSFPLGLSRDGQPGQILRLKPWQLRCMVNETFRQPKPGTRGPKPVPWEIAVKRIQRMLMARDALRRQGEDVTKPAILQWMGQRGSTKTIDRWLDAAHLRWNEFLAL
jgi:hypothetical protein